MSTHRRFTDPTFRLPPQSYISMLLLFIYCYFTNTLIMPVINGPTEGLMLIYLCHFFTAIVGADWWAQPFGKSLPFLSWVPLINEIPTNKVTLFAIIVFAIIPTSLFNVYNVCKVVQARKGSMLLALAMVNLGLIIYDVTINYGKPWLH
ncbi:choline/ethanolaminephosphotransferase 2-like isoform X1 [Camellia sinensis]|uniref:choline/ethanolaminephosphotransferase 2-like isoform X1 n=1 Tax=Camellia sinensis TaxID=4442 RepID=UPI0010355E72|nr:choline/ethanolaminephosphotransferase 2-like isoform X1 [Camellia sinensis]XP_028069034.1 choline/ethanolaminephosphotransferase 2-like isoform X1 [Camellia sinensis]